MELKPCPFCGEKASITLPHEGGAYLSHNCIFVSGCWFENAERAERFWNTRAERTCKNVGERTDFCCSECGTRLYTHMADGFTMIKADGNTIIEIPGYCPSCGAKVVEA